MTFTAISSIEHWTPIWNTKLSPTLRKTIACDSNKKLQTVTKNLDVALRNLLTNVETSHVDARVHVNTKRHW